MASIIRFLPLSLSVLAVLVQAQVSSGDVSGIGHILVWNSSDWATAKPEQKVGCLDDDGRFIKEESTEECGTFAVINDYPWTMSSKRGNCTFTDVNTPANTDSHYGKGDHAWTCNATYVANIYDELYTVNGFPYPFLCFGDIACYYDAKKIPGQGEKIPLWQFRWGSEQMGITPGHVQLQLVWNKTGELRKREDNQGMATAQFEFREQMQKPILQGQKASWRG